MRRVITISLLCFAQALISQSSLTEIKRNIYQNLNSSVNQNYIRLINEGMTSDGSNEYFAFEDWTEFQVESQEGDLINLDSANYHIHDDIMLFIDEGAMFFLFPEQVDRIYADDMVFTSYKHEKNKYNYFEILAQGEFQLLKKYKVIKERVVDNPLGITHGTQEYTFKRKPEYYYYDVIKEQINRVPKKKKDLIRIFKKNKSKMLDFARLNKLNSKSEEDLITLFDYYNQLN